MQDGIATSNDQTPPPTPRPLTQVFPSFTPTKGGDDRIVSLVFDGPSLHLNPTIDRDLYDSSPSYYLHHLKFARSNLPVLAMGY